MKIIRTLMKITVLIIVVIIVAVVLGLGYFGFIPSISKAFGSDKPRDLGIKYIQADYDSSTQKGKVKTNTIDLAQDTVSSIKWEGANEIKNSWTSEEITAKINMNSANWQYFPVKDVQVKFNTDGSAELAGILLIDRLRGYAQATNIPEKDIKAVSDVIDKYKISRKPTPIYMKVNLTIKDNNVDITVPKLEIGRLPVPRSLYKPAKSYFENFAKEQLTGGGYGDLDIKSLDFNNGKLNFDGVLPASVTTAKTILTNNTATTQ